MKGFCQFVFCITVLFALCESKAQSVTNYVDMTSATLSSTGCAASNVAWTGSSTGGTGLLTDPAYPAHMTCDYTTTVSFNLAADNTLLFNTSSPLCFCTPPMFKVDVYLDGVLVHTLNTAMVPVQTTSLGVLAGTHTLSYRLYSAMGASLAYNGAVSYITSLPVSLISSSIHKSENGWTMDWSTASQENMLWYSIQGSEDGKVFTEIDRVDPVDQGNRVINYRVKGHRLYPYYRLGMKDEQSITYSRIMFLNEETEIEPLIWVDANHQVLIAHVVPDEVWVSDMIGNTIAYGSNTVLTTNLKGLVIVTIRVGNRLYKEKLFL